MDTKDKILFTFNKFFYDFIKAVKDLDDGLKERIRKVYKVKDNTTLDNMQFFQSQLNEDICTLIANTDDMEVLVQNESFQNLCIFKGYKERVNTGVTVKDIISCVDNETVPTICSYIYVFMLMHLVTETQAQEQEAMYEAVMATIRTIQRGEDIANVMDDILDDDISSILLKFKKTQSVVHIDVGTPAPTSTETETETGTGNVPSFLNPEMLMNTKIGKLAQEITSEIDMTDLNIEKPEDLMDMSKIEKIVGQVGKKITQKLSSGDLNQNDLMAEVTSMMSQMSGGKGGKGGGDIGDIFNSPMFKQAMQAFGMGGDTSGSKAVVDVNKLKTASTRDRLRRKVEERSVDGKKK